MHIAKSEVPVRLSVPRATARQTADFGDATGFGKMAGEYFRSRRARTSRAASGTSGRPVPVPALGLRAQGRVTVTYTGGDTETVAGGDLFYWPPGHSVRVDEDAEIVLFSPRHSTRT